MSSGQPHFSRPKTGVDKATKDHLRIEEMVNKAKFVSTVETNSDYNDDQMTNIATG